MVWYSAKHGGRCVYTLLNISLSEREIWQRSENL